MVTSAMESGVVRSRAPLRLGLAGGGTDLSPYCDEFGGSVLNITINRYAFATLTLRSDGLVEFVSDDLGQREIVPAAAELPLQEGLRLHRAVYNRVVRDFGLTAPALTLTTTVECPMGAGLGASSALTVAMLGAFRTMFSLPLGEFDLAHLAYEVERIDLDMSGGRQDQYAATFGGVNFMEFACDDRVIVNPLDLPEVVVHELEASLLLCFTGHSRLSSDIIATQVSALRGHNERSVEAMHRLKRNALEMKAALLRGELDRVPALINEGWIAKKATAPDITTSQIDRLHAAAMAAGAAAGKISGAGGGGFLMLLVDPLRREAVRAALTAMGAEVSTCSFASRGATGWFAPRLLDARSGGEGVRRARAGGMR
jgi:D-glycero-alpha-D-manno-heptose-7-phosphate kinase